MIRYWIRDVSTFLAAYIGFTIETGNLLLLALPFAIARIAIGCAESAEHSAVATMTPAHLRGSEFRLLATVQAGGNLAASAVAGFLWTPHRLVRSAAWMLHALAGLAATAGILDRSPGHGRRRARRR